MFTLKHFRKIMVLFTMVMCFFIIGTLAEVMTSYSGKYTADLEKKQMLLESVKEEVHPVGSEPQHNVDNQKKAVEKNDRASLRLENINLAQIVPPVERIKVAYVGMSGTLSPQSSKKDFIRSKSNSRQ